MFSDIFVLEIGNYELPLKFIFQIGFLPRFAWVSLLLNQLVVVIFHILCWLGINFNRKLSFVSTNREIFFG